MGTRNSSGVERRRVPLDGNRPRTHPKHSGQQATKADRRPPSAMSALKDGGLLERLACALAGWSTIDARVDGEEKRIGGAP